LVKLWAFQGGAWAASLKMPFESFSNIEKDEVFANIIFQCKLFYVKKAKVAQNVTFGSESSTSPFK
jgi:hypothetical protein